MLDITECLIKLTTGHCITNAVDLLIQIEIRSIKVNYFYEANETVTKNGDERENNDAIKNHSNKKQKEYEVIINDDKTKLTLEIKRI